MSKELRHKKHTIVAAVCSMSNLLQCEHCVRTLGTLTRIRHSSFDTLLSLFGPWLLGKTMRTIDLQLSMAFRSDSFVTVLQVVVLVVLL